MTRRTTFQRSHRLAPGADMLPLFLNGEYQVSTKPSIGSRRRPNSWREGVRIDSFNEAIDWLPAQTESCLLQDEVHSFNEAIDWLPAQTGKPQMGDWVLAVSTKPSIGSRRRPKVINDPNGVFEVSTKPSIGSRRRRGYVARREVSLGFQRSHRLAPGADRKFVRFRPHPPNVSTKPSIGSRRRLGL